jgi:hypothetical protein
MELDHGHCLAIRQRLRILGLKLFGRWFVRFGGLGFLGVFGFLGHSGNMADLVSGRQGLNLQRLELSRPTVRS